MSDIDLVTEDIDRTEKNKAALVFLRALCS